MTMAANILTIPGTTLGRQLTMVRFWLYKIYPNVKIIKVGEGFLIDWMWGVRKERNRGRWYECLEGERYARDRTRIQ